MPVNLPGITVCRIDLARPADASALLELLEHYARDPMGGGEGLSAYAREQVVPRLHAWPGYIGFLARDGETPCGLINCFIGFSTFAARPLLNVHDIVVASGWRGRGIARGLLTAAEEAAREAGCCKLTLEVLSNNHRACATYTAFGFAPYELDPAAGQATFMQKWL